MANKVLFSSTPANLQATTTNNAGGHAYTRTAENVLAQLAVTGTFNPTFYVNEETQLAQVIEVCKQVDAKFIAQAAIYSRQFGYMKDMPAFLLATLAAKDVQLAEQIFPQVVSNGKMLRNFVQILRSGVVGRRSFGTVIQRMISNWLNQASDSKIIQASVGTNPSLADIIKICHVKPQTYERGALFAWVIKKLKDEQVNLLPPVIQQLEAFRRGETDEIPNVPFELLTSTELTQQHWELLALRGAWHMTRMNLNTFLRKGVFYEPGMVDQIAKKLVDEDVIKRSNVFPYQCLTAYKYVDDLMPMGIRLALQDVLDLSLSNVPNFGKNTIVAVDVSGSMHDPITGNRGTATSKIRRIDVASLIAAAILKSNPTATIIPFDTQLHIKYRLNPRDSIVTITQQLSKFGGGGTNCGMVMEYANQQRLKADLIIYVSDYESWVGTNLSAYRHATVTASEFAKFKKANPYAKLVCIDLSPNTTVQAPSEMKDVLNIGGFSDIVFKLIYEFSNGSWSKDFWINQIKQIQL